MHYTTFYRKNIQNLCIFCDVFVKIFKAALRLASLCLSPAFADDSHRKTATLAPLVPTVTFSTLRYVFRLLSQTIAIEKRQLSLRSFLRSLCSLRCPFFYASLCLSPAFADDSHRKTALQLSGRPGLCPHTRLDRNFSEDLLLRYAMILSLIHIY